MWWMRSTTRLLYPHSLSYHDTNCIQHSQLVAATSDTVIILAVSTRNILCKAQMEVGAKNLLRNTNCCAKDNGMTYAAFRHLALLKCQDQVDWQV